MSTPIPRYRPPHKRAPQSSQARAQAVADPLPSGEGGRPSDDQTRIEQSGAGQNQADLRQDRVRLAPRRQVVNVCSSFGEDHKNESPLELESADTEMTRDSPQPGVARAHNLEVANPPSSISSLTLPDLATLMKERPLKLSSGLIPPHSETEKMLTGRILESLRKAGAQISNDSSEPFARFDAILDGFSRNLNNPRWLVKLRDECKRIKDDPCELENGISVSVWLSIWATSLKLLIILRPLTQEEEEALENRRRMFQQKADRLEIHFNLLVSMTQPQLLADLQKATCDALSIWFDMGPTKTASSKSTLRWAILQWLADLSARLVSIDVETGRRYVECVRITRLVLCEAPSSDMFVNELALFETELNAVLETRTKSLAKIVTEFKSKYILLAMTKTLQGNTLQPEQFVKVWDPVHRFLMYMLSSNLTSRFEQPATPEVRDS